MNHKGRHVGKAPVDLARVREVVEPIVVVHGVRLLDVEWTTGPPGRILRLTIDRETGDQAPSGPGGGVTLEDCVRVSRDASTALDVDDFIAASYHLEVSSPGLDRALRTADELRSIVGQTAKTKLRQPAADGQRVLRGTVLDVADDLLSIEVDGRRHEVPLADVDTVTRVLDFGGKSRPKAGGRGKRRANARRTGRQGKRGAAAETSTAASPKRQASRKDSSSNRAG